MSRILPYWSAMPVVCLPGLPNVTPVGNVGAGEDNLMSYTIPAGLMSRNGDAIGLHYMFSRAGSHTVKIYINGSESTGGGFTLSCPAGGNVSGAFGRIIRMSATTGLFMDFITLYGAVALTGLDFTAPIVVQFTGQSGEGSPANNDIVQTYLGGEFYPAAD